MFASSFERNQKFWNRLGVKPDFEEKSILDIGSGFGNLAIEMAQSGAKRVLGIEIDERYRKYSRDKVDNDYPELKEKIEFKLSDLKDIESESFDLITALDVFEHLIDFDTTFNNLVRVLKPGGKLYIGFAPLYKSPFGFHGRLRGLVPFVNGEIPWLHVLLSRRHLVRLYNKIHDAKMKKIQDLGLNGLGYSDYMNAFKKSGLRIQSVKYNVTKSKFSRILSIMARIPFIKDFCVHSLYVVLGKP